MLNELQFHEWDPTTGMDSSDEGAPEDDKDQDKEM